MYVDSGARGGDGTDQRVQLTSYVLGYFLLGTPELYLTSCICTLQSVPCKEVQMAVKSPDRLLHPPGYHDGGGDGGINGGGGVLSSSRITPSPFHNIILFILKSPNLMIVIAASPGPRTDLRSQF